MGRWSGLSGLIDFHFDHGHSGGGSCGKSSVNVTTRYHKLDDSIFVLCRNCGQNLPYSSKKDEMNKKMDVNEGVKLGRNPKHFLTWSATAANNRLQKMSKTLANNLIKIIPFQQGVGASGEFCSKTCENNEPCCGHLGRDSDNNNRGHNPDVVNVNVSKVMSVSTPSCCNTSDSGSSDVKLINKMVQQLGEIGRYHYDTTRIQSARIVQSHPSVSQCHSQGKGSVAIPDKIIQINVESYNVYSPEEVEEQAKVTSSDDINVKSGTMEDTHNKNDKIVVDMKSLDLFYDSGTGSISGSSLSSPSTVSDLPVNNSVAWNRAAKKSSSLSPNLNSSSPSVMSQSKRGHDSNNSDSNTNQGVVKKMNNSNTSAAGENASLTQDSNNSTNSGVSIVESTDEKSLLIENNKSNAKQGLKNTGAKNVEICNNKNSVALKPGNLGSPPMTTLKTPLRLKSLKSQSYPPSSKLAVTIFEKEGELRNVPWFQPGIPRDLALEILRNEPICSFLVRESTTKTGCFALSLRVPKEYQPCGIAHYLILKSSRGYKIKGFTKEFASLTSLITHHSVLKELLPCPLSLHQYQLQVKTLRVSRANSSDFMDFQMEPEKLLIGKYTDF